MSAHNVAKQIHGSTPMLDPGSAGVITVDRSPAFVALVTTGAQSRTLARPTREGVFLVMHFKTDGGDCTVTVTGGHNEAGATTIVFANAGEFAMLVSCYDGTNYFWRTVSNSGVGNTPVAQGAALTAAKAAFTIADAEGTPDNAIAAVTSTTPFGFTNAAELITLLFKVQNLHVRVGEIEAALEAAGIVAAN